MMFRFFSLPGIKIELVHSECERSVEDFQVPKSIFIMVQHLLAVDAQGVVQMEELVGSESSTGVWAILGKI